MIYRSKAEMDVWKGRDPVSGFRGRLLADAGIPEHAVAAVERAVQALLDEAVAFAAASPKPAPEMALTGVYGETHAGWVF